MTTPKPPLTRSNVIVSQESTRLKDGTWLPVAYTTDTRQEYLDGFTGPYEIIQHEGQQVALLVKGDW